MINTPQRVGNCPMNILNLYLLKTNTLITNYNPTTALKKYAFDQIIINSKPISLFNEYLPAYFNFQGFGFFRKKHVS